ncbi:uncharacterized protein DKFZp434B061 [Rhipicephalus sanguineus]|uniref:uncharacterized protein DKFZp434B061 n=1 Tax=Rhipicephalus sanguineus TaxID=34632 RepID=UPI0018958C73|nr:uncharacterized protein DKFZp434B061 [Rhipicephalus sanguineus]
MATTERSAPFRAVVLETPITPLPVLSQGCTQRQPPRTSRCFNTRRRLRTSASSHRHLLQTLPKNHTQDATPHPTPAASPISPDPTSAPTADDPVCASRRPVTTIEQHASTSLHSGSVGRTYANDSVASDASHAASSSSANPPTIEESPSTDNGTVHIEESDSSSSEKPLQIEEDATPSEVSWEVSPFWCPPPFEVPASSVTEFPAAAWKHAAATGPLRTPMRPRKPRSSGASPGRKKRLNRCGARSPAPAPTESSPALPSLHCILIFMALTLKVKSKNAWISYTNVP